MWIRRALLFFTVFAAVFLLETNAGSGGFAARALGQVVDDQAYTMTYADEGFISKEKNQALVQVCLILVATFLNSPT